jgi:hypothetical protein
MNYIHRADAARRCTARTAIFLLLVVCAHSAAHANSSYDVTINTSALSGTDATLAFDFIAGGSFSNIATISDFLTSGSAGTNGPNSGSVSGALPGTVTLSDASFFNEFLQSITLGSRISFELSATTHAPTGGALPDTFSFFILNPAASFSLLTTTDPTGADSLFSLQIDGSPNGIVASYSATPAVSVTLTPVGTSNSVPEPSALGLMIFGLLGAVFRRRSVTRS